MSVSEQIKNDIQMGIKLLAFKPVKAEIAPMSVVEDTLKSEGWEPISAAIASEEGRVFSRYFYNSMQKVYAHVTCNGYTGACEIQVADETEMLQSMSFAELKHLATLIDKKTVAFIRIYSEKELAAAKTDEELQALNARNEKMIAEAEVALRKR